MHVTRRTRKVAVSTLAGLNTTRGGSRGGSLGSRDPPLQVEPQTGNLRQKVHGGKLQITKDRYTLIEQSRSI